MADKLTAKQERFALEYLVDRNAAQAAIRAGYSAKTAKVIGCENLTKPNVQAEIARLERPELQKLAITREAVMRELAAIGFARAPDFVNVTTERAMELGVHPLTGEVMMLPIGRQQVVRVTNTAELPEDKAAAVAGIKQGAHGIEVKLHDKTRALELLAKILGLLDSKEPTDTAENNLFDAIVDNTQEELETCDIPEIEQAAAAGVDVVEPSEL